VLESLLGILLGIALADVLALWLGTGLWQLVVVLLVVFVVGRALSPNPAFAVAAAVPSALVMLLPPPEGGPFERSLDGLVGGVVALLVTALVPRDPPNRFVLSIRPSRALQTDTRPVRVRRSRRSDPPYRRARRRPSP